MAAEEVLSYYIKAFDLATPVFQRFGTEVESTTRRVQASLVEQNKALIAQSAEARKLTSASRDLTAQQTVSQRAHRDTALATGAVAGAHREATTEIERHKNTLQQLGYGLSGFSGQLGPLGRSLDQATKHAQLFRSQGVDYINAGLVGGAAALVAYGIHAQSTFESLSRSIQQQTGVGSRAAQQLLADVQQVATQAPASYQQIAQAVSAQYNLFGHSNAAIQKNTDLFIAFAEAANRQVTPTIQGLSDVMRNWHPHGKNVVDVMDQLLNLSQRTQRPLGSYLDLMTRFGPQFQAMGLDLNQTVGLFDLFSKRGVTATQMGRGLASMMSSAEREVKAAHKALQDGPAVLQQYADRVDAAQIRVNELNSKIAAGTGNTALYHQQLVIASNELSIATGKYQQERVAIDQAAHSHMTVASVVKQEMLAIEQAKTKADALNLGYAAFGTRLGPQMADVLWHNKKSLDQLSAALGDGKGKVEAYAHSLADTLHGRMEILTHDFTQIAASVAQVALPPLEAFMGVVTNIAHAVQQLPKPLLDALVFGGAGVGASLLVARHTPIGAGIAKLGGPDWWKAMITGKGPVSQAIAGAGSEVSGGLVGFDGLALMVGSRGNPIAVLPVGGFGLPGGSSSSSTPLGRSVAAGATEAEMAAAGEGAAGGAVVGELAPEASAGIGAAVASGMGKFLGIAGIGVLGSQLAGGIVGGHAGSIISRVGSTAAVGAAAGSLIGPEGTLIGGGIGAAVGGLSLLLGGSTDKLAAFQAQAKKLAADGDIAGLVKLRDQAESVGQSMDILHTRMGVIHTQDGAQMLDWVNNLNAAIPVLRANISNASDALAGPMDQELQKLTGQYGFPGMTKAMNDTSLSVSQKAADIVASLKSIADNGTGPMAQNAQAALTQLTTTWNADLTQLGTQTTASMNSLKTQITDGSYSAVQGALGSFKSYSSGVASAMQAGVLATQAGVKLIAKALNDEIKALGGKEIPLAAFQGSSAASVMQYANWYNQGAAGGGIGSGIGKRGATGLRVPGAVGGDNWTLVDPAGRPAAMVGGGELLVSNRHTEAAASAATVAMYGKTLGQMVAGESRPHSMATGGTLSYSQLEGLWISAGGPAGVAPTAAAIAMAESGGRDVMQQGQPWATTGWGYWQITPGGPQYLDPMTNARMAVSDYRGRGFEPWTTYNDGAYRQFLQGGISPSKGGIAGVGPMGAVGALRAPRVSGSGMISGVANAGLAYLTNAANAYLQHLAPMMGAVANTGGGGYQMSVPTGGAPPGLARMIAEANAIASHGYNYEWGGGHGGLGVPSHGYGHGSGPGVGFDCSGAVSAILGAAGLISSPMVASQFMQYGDPGPGKWLSIFADPVHTFMQLNGRYFGTSLSNPGGGANWFSSFPGNIGGPRHPHGFATGGILSGLDGAAAAMAAANGLLPGMGGGGRLAYAGAFGGGGSVTATGPTLAMFGDRGTETAMFVPHYQTGGGIPLPSPTVGAEIYPTVAHHKHKVAASHKPRTKFNPLTDQIETHTEAEWQLIDAEVAKERHLASAAKKAFDAYMKETLTDSFTAGGLHVGGEQLTRRAALAAGLPGTSGTRALTGSLLGGLSMAGFSHVASVVGKAEAGDSVHQLLKIAGGGSGLTGQTRRAESHLEAIHDHISKLREDAKKHADDRHADAVKIHSLQGQANQLSHGIQRLQTLETTTLQNAVKDVSKAVASAVSDVTSDVGTLRTIASLPAGTTAASLGLSPGALSAAGINPNTFASLVGGGTGSPAYLSAVQSTYAGGEQQLSGDIGQYQQIMRTAPVGSTAYNAAKTGLGTAVQQLLGMAGSADTDIAGAVEQQYQTGTQNITQGTDLLSMVQNAAPGTDLSYIANSPLAAQLPPGWQNLVGTGSTYLSKLQSQQGGVLTPAQISAGQTGYGALITSEQGQRSSYVGLLNTLEGELPTLTGSAATTAQTHITDLIKAIAGLDTSIQDNTDASKALTSATNANTNATGQMTGTVGYSYQNQDYVAGTSTSDSSANILMGS